MVRYMLILDDGVRNVGTNGQISLGKHYAGKQVLIEEQESGVWLIRTVKVIPDNEAWIHESRVAERLQEAMNCAVSHTGAFPVRDARLNKLGLTVLRVNNEQVLEQLDSVLAQISGAIRKYNE